MTYYFIIQAEGRGHMSQSIAMQEQLRDEGHEVIGIAVGLPVGREVPNYFIEQFESVPQLIYEAPTLIFNTRKKELSILKTLFFNLNPRRFWGYLQSASDLKDEINNLKPDRVVNFCELIGGVSTNFINKKIEVEAIGHHFVLNHPDVKIPLRMQPNLTMIELCNAIIRSGANRTTILSISKLRDVPEKNLYVAKPLLRKSLKTYQATRGNYLMGYLLNSYYIDEVIFWHSKNREVEIHLFTDSYEYGTVVNGNIYIHPLTDKKFLEMLAGCRGYFTTAGFESICEALYYDKTILVVPAHQEQELNAYEAGLNKNVIVQKSFDLTSLWQSV